MVKKTITTITIDERTKQALDDFAKNRSLSRSACIRMILNEYLHKT
jgi:hypothetical protein